MAKLPAPVAPARSSQDVALASKLKVFLSWEQLCFPTPASLAGSSITNHSWLCPSGCEAHCPVICAGITLGRGNGEALLDEPTLNECSHFPQRDVVMLELFGKIIPSVGTGFVIPIVHPHCSAWSISSVGIPGHELPVQEEHSLCCDKQAHTTLEVTMAQTTTPGVRQNRPSWKHSPDSTPSPCKPQLWYSPKSPASSSTLNTSQCPLHVSRGATVRVSCPLPTANRLCRL